MKKITIQFEGYNIVLEEIRTIQGPIEVVEVIASYVNQEGPSELDDH